MRKRKKELIQVEFSHEDNDFVAYGYPEYFLERNEFTLQDEFSPAEVTSLLVYVELDSDDLLYPIPQIQATPINLELYYNDFYDIIEVAKEKINEKHYDTID